MARAVGISALAHGAAIVIASLLVERGPLDAIARRTAIEIEIVPERDPPAPAPLDEPAPVATEAPTPRAARAAVAIATIRSEPIPTPGEPALDRPTNALAMRGMRHDLALSTEGAQRIAGSGGAPAEGPEQPVEPRWSYDPKIKLRDAGGGKKVVRDAVGTFSVAPDGTVDIEHAPYFTFELDLPTPESLRRRWRWFKKDFNRWVADPYRDTRVGKSQDLPNHLLAVPGACDRYGSTDCFTAADQQKRWEEEDDGLHTGTGGLAGGRADITGYLHDKFVGDPYASRKLKILDQTRDERARIGGEYREEQLDRSAELVQRNLESLWRTTTDPAQRRSTLFAMWDECDEGDGSRGEAGERARMMVVGWIRAKLPQGTPGAFTVDEIAKLDAARSSKQHFVPYL